MAASERYRIMIRSALQTPPRKLIGHLGRRASAFVIPRISSIYQRRVALRARQLPDIAYHDHAVGVANFLADFCDAEARGAVQDYLEGRFEIMGKLLEFDSPADVDWGIFIPEEGNRQLRRSSLAHLAFLPVVVRRDASAAMRFVAELLPGFVEAGDFSRPGVLGNIWHPYVVSRRVQSILSALVLLPAELRNLPAAIELQRLLKFDVAYLIEHLETELGFNHLERNLAALAAFGVAATVFPTEIADELHANLPALMESIGPDGVQKERSPYYQFLSAQSFHIFEMAGIWSVAERASISAVSRDIRLALKALTLGDGFPALFNDGFHGESPEVRSIFGGDDPGFHVMPDAGYVRLADEHWTVVFDAGAIGPPSTSGHGHADFLSFEASIGRLRLVVDPGTFSYSADGKRDVLRAWRSHNGPCFVGPEPVEFVGSFWVGRRAAAVLEACGIDEEGCQRATGMLAFDDLETTRSIELRPDGRLTVVDRWSAAECPAQTRLLIPVEWELELERQAIRLRHAEFEVRLEWGEHARAAVGRAEWSRYYQQTEPCHEIVLSPAAGHDSIRFSFKRC